MRRLLVSFSVLACALASSSVALAGAPAHAAGAGSGSLSGTVVASGDYWLSIQTSGRRMGVTNALTRAADAITTPPDYKKTPSKIGYEIQINNRFPDPHPSGSIYGFMDAPKEIQFEDDWNSMDISSHNDKITVKLNGKLAAEHAGDPKRSKTGPIGLQLHDQFSIIMFRNVKIKEL